MTESRANQSDGSRLDTFQRLAMEAGCEPMAADARSLAGRVRAGRFYVVCVGQYKRGKSTLLNALMGERVLPVGVVPLTVVVTILRYGTPRTARVQFADGSWADIEPDAIAEYVTEEKNPENSKGVAVVEVLTPNSLLESGLCLVDTPGIGSVFIDNTEATRAFVPHIDAALVVLGTDPPISAAELVLVEEIARQCPELIFVLGKADKQTDADRVTAAAFTSRILRERLGRDIPSLIEVSAAERLAGAGELRGWPDLVAALHRLALHSKGELVRQAEARGFAMLAHRLRHVLQEQRDALFRPVEASQLRVEQLQALVAEAAVSLNDLGYLFTAEQDRLSRLFAEQKDAFLRRAQPESRQELGAALRAEDRQHGPVSRDQAVQCVHTITRRWLDQWLAEAQPAAESLYVEAMARFVSLANDFLGKLATTGDPALAALPQVVGPEIGFRVSSGLYYTSLMNYTQQTVMEWLLNLIRTRHRKFLALERRMGEYQDLMLLANANRIAKDFEERVMESRRKLQAEIHAILSETVTTAERAWERARTIQAQGTQSIETEIQRLDALQSRLEQLGGSQTETA